MRCRKNYGVQKEIPCQQRNYLLLCLDPKKCSYGVYGCLLRYHGPLRYIFLPLPSHFLSEPLLLTALPCLLSTFMYLFIVIAFAFMYLFIVIVFSGEFPHFHCFLCVNYMILFCDTNIMKTSFCLSKIHNGG